MNPRMMHYRMADPDPSLIGGGGGGGSGTDFRDALPDDLKNDPSLADIRSVEALAKSFVSAQKMIGTDKIAAPNEKWTDDQWGDFFSKTGRPEKADGYDISAVKGKGILSDTGVDQTVGKFHEIGLSDRQSKELLSFYQDQVDGQVREIEQAVESARIAARDALMAEHGDKFDMKMDVAKSALDKFGSPELKKKLDETGLGNDPEMIKLFMGIGEQFLEDDPGNAEGEPLGIQNSSSALREIEALKLDQEFLGALNDESHVGHTGAVERWLGLHTKAHGNESVTPA